ncbi:MAG: transglycosylase SLT domain-containing protein [Geobacteraceae bacterium]|nr:transglycosylase SLT domain-containing protein [Geobacteraceae bacterium]
MKIFTITAIICLLALSASVAETIASQAVRKPLAESSDKTAQGASGEKRPRKVSVPTSLSDEKSLCKALGLPANDLLVADVASDGFDEFELKIQEYNLPESDIPLTINSKVEYFINFFQTSGRSWFGKWLSRSERYIPMMKEVLREKSLPEDLVYLAMIESGFSPHAYSRAKAVGPWQFIAGTGKRYSLRIDPWIDERRDPLKSTVAAAMYLKQLYSLFNKDWYLAAAGYNAGENKILRAIDMYNSNDFWELAEGSYLKRETKDYVPKLLAAAIIAKEPAKYGFADIAYLPPIELDTVSIPSRTDLDLVAQLTGVSYETIRELNPELKKWCTPPDYPNYALKLPKGKKALFLAAYEKIPAEERYVERVVYTRYRARKGDTIASVARRFGADPTEVAAVNHLSLKRKQKLRGKVLSIPVNPVCIPSAVTQTASAPEKKKKNQQAVQYYTVKRGDTLSSLARRFNVTTKAIAGWNNLSLKGILKPGRRIIVAKSGEAHSS